MVYLLCVNVNLFFQQSVILVCICVCSLSDLAQDLIILEEHFGYSYIELQLVSQLASQLSLVVLSEI